MSTAVRDMSRDTSRGTNLDAAPDTSRDNNRDTRRDIGLRIKHISVALDQMRTAQIAELGLTSSQGLVLRYLNRHRGEPIYPSDLVRQFGLSQPTVTGILRRLEDKGFLEFQADRGDRRRKSIVATDKALCCHRQIVAGLQRTEDMLMGGLTGEELDRLCLLLDKVLDNILRTGALPEPFLQEVVHD